LDDRGLQQIKITFHDMFMVTTLSPAQCVSVTTHE